MSQILGTSGGGSGGTVTSVTGGNNITITGNPAVNPTVNVSGTTHFAVQVGSAAGALTSLALGTAGQVLTSNGAGVNPSFQAAGGGGGPAFLTYLATSVSNVTGDGTNYQILFDTVGFDRTSNISGGIFTAPTTGIYYFAAEIFLTPVNNVSFTTAYLLIVKNSFAEYSTNPYLNPFAVASGPNLGINGTQIFSLTAGDTVSVYANVTGGGRTIGLNGNSGTLGNGYPTAFYGFQIM